MLRELRVENLGVIADLGLVLGPGMTVLTGETGAGKTLVVEAIELLLGARADTGLVRAGAGEAVVEARFDRDTGGAGDGDGEDEVVLTRVIPAEGRSRSYLNGRAVPAGVLAEVGGELVDLHGQHSHQHLLTPAAQRRALDRFAGPPALDALDTYRAARERVRRLDEELASVGGDARERAREVDLLRFQIEEIDGAAVEDAAEDERLAAEEALLADATAHRDAATAAYAALEGAAMEALGEAVTALEGRAPFEALAERARVLQEEAADLGRELRRTAEGIEDDPGRLEAVGARRRLLRELGRKYGDTLADVLAYREEVAERLETLVGAEARAAQIEGERVAALEDARLAAQRLTAARTEAASRLGEAITAELRELAMPAAELTVQVTPAAAPGEDGADEVTFLLAANKGEPAQPLARVASGGELARTMLAARVVLSEAPPTLVFDEVDAGIGGQAGVAVGRRLALVAAEHQVLCVTHLAQVAAFADAHVVVEKGEEEGRTVARAAFADGPERVAELSRMLAGSGSERARQHAEELLASAADARPGANAGGSTAW